MTNIARGSAVGALLSDSRNSARRRLIARMSDPRFDRDDEPMPAWRGRSTLAVSVGVHAAAVIACLMIAAMPPVVEVPAAAPMREIARIELPPREEPHLPSSGRFLPRS